MIEKNNKINVNYNRYYIKPKRMFRIMEIRKHLLMLLVKNLN